MDVKSELAKIDEYFNTVSNEALIKDLKECGLGVIRDCTESGWVMQGAKNAEQLLQPD